MKSLFQIFVASVIVVAAATAVAAEAETLRLAGVVTSVTDDDLDAGYYWVRLRNEWGAHDVAIKHADFPMTNALALVDGEVAFSGKWGIPQAYRRALDQFLEHDGRMPEILKAPPRDEEIPEIGRGDPKHRHRITRKVLAVTGRSFYTDFYVKAVLRDGETPPRCGDVVTIAGFVRPRDPCDVIFDATILKTVRHDDSSAAELPRSDVETLFHDACGNELVDAHKHGMSIRLVGDVVSRSQHEREVAEFDLTCGKRTIHVDASAFPADADEVLPGCRMDVSGVITVEMTAADTDTPFSVVQRLVLIPRTPADLRIVARPPWWTAKRLWMLSAALLAIVTLLALLSRLLWIRAERKAREAYHDRLAREHAETRTAERTRLASDLHDTIAQNLTGVDLQLDSARRALERRPEATGRHLETAGRILGSLRTELRRCIWDLRYDTLDMGNFEEAIRKTVEPVLGEAKLAIRVVITRARLDDTVAHTVLSVSRELVSNAVRHGQARTIRIAGCIDGGTLMLSVTDDGCGFDPGKAPGMNEGHFGLVGIRDRIRGLGGGLEVDGAPGRGAAFKLKLPI